MLTHTFGNQAMRLLAILDVLGRVLSDFRSALIFSGMGYLYSSYYARSASRAALKRALQFSQAYEAGSAARESATGAQCPPEIRVHREFDTALRYESPLGATRTTIELLTAFVTVDSRPGQLGMGMGMGMAAAGAPEGQVGSSGAVMHTCGVSLSDFLAIACGAACQRQFKGTLNVVCCASPRNVVGVA